MKLQLPWPPSINHYWRHVGARVLISQEGRAYRSLIVSLALLERWPKFGASRLRVIVSAHPPDRRRRDLDNIFKVVGDSLTECGVWTDDSQIDDLRIIRMPIGNRICLEIEAMT